MRSSHEWLMYVSAHLWLLLVKFTIMAVGLYQIAVLPRISVSLM